MKKVTYLNCLGAAVIGAGIILYCTLNPVQQKHTLTTKELAQHTIYETEHAVVYADPQRPHHRIAATKNPLENSTALSTQLCWAAKESTAQDFSWFMDISTPAETCSLCKKIGYRLNNQHAHIAVGKDAAPIPVQIPCEFCEIAQGKRTPGRNQDGRIIATSDKAVLFTKDGGFNVINNCLAIPQAHITNLKTMAATDLPTLQALFALIQDSMHKVTPHEPYVLVTNSGAHSPCRQSVFHMHFHIEAPDDCRFDTKMLE